MRSRQPFVLLLLAVSFGGCDWLTGQHGEDEQPGNASTGAEGRAEAGQVALKAPGLDVTFTVPKSLTRDVKVHNDIKILYPKTSITGMYAAGGSDGKNDRSEVEFRFTSADAPETIAGWYRDPTRSAAFKLKSIKREGAEIVVRGSEVADDDHFKIRLAAKTGGGTDGRLIIRNRD